jgi:hypothetical protein
MKWEKKAGFGAAKALESRCFGGREGGEER